MERIDKLIQAGAGTRFSSTNQPKKRRKSLKRQLEDVLDNEGFMVIEDGEFEVQKDGTCHLFIPDLRKILVTLIKKAGDGDLKAMEMLFDRMDGRPQASINVIEPTISANFFEEMEVDSMDDDGEENNLEKPI